ncbi:MAG: hypothetical protein SLAVMIC_00621 [uncultured marine phage]|uniref:Uncharacterized protein n=1 Tax=uncultured marine phage TaxID=707152 RepID=A0A8D9C985_9VIRU|nr:MAG: hypothetical protein SLAVMIC_00621 [uncultured marine phage]
MKNIKLKDLGFVEDDIQPNHWNNGEYLLYQTMYGEYALATFNESGEIEIVHMEDNFYLMKVYLSEEFRGVYREKRLSDLLDKDQMKQVIEGFSLN